MNHLHFTYYRYRVTIWIMVCRANIFTIFLFYVAMAGALGDTGFVQTRQAMISTKEQIDLSREQSLRLRYRVLGDYLPLSPCPERVRIKVVEEAQARFPTIQRDVVMFPLILGHLGLAGAGNFGLDEKFLVYREYQRLNAVQLEPLGDRITFTIVPPAEPNCAELHHYPGSGSIDVNGNIISPVGRAIFGVSGGSTSPPGPASSQSTLSNPELRVSLQQHFGELVECEPKRKGQVERSAELHRYEAIRQDARTFQAILLYLGLAESAELSEVGKLQVVREYYKLARIQLEPLAHKFQFKMLVRDRKNRSKSSDLFNIDGLIDSRGAVTELKRTVVWYSPCFK